MTKLTEVKGCNMNSLEIEVSTNTKDCIGYSSTQKVK
jgi:hypothetical protein